MTKSSDPLDAAFCEVVADRDARVRDRTIAPKRLEGLHEVVACEFPLEKALRDTAVQRDGALSPRTHEIPNRVRAGLLEQERQRQVLGRSARYAARALIRLRGVLQSPEMIGAATAILLLAGLLFFEFRHVSTKEAAKVERRPLAGFYISEVATDPGQHLRRDHFLTGPGSHLVLQVSTAELAKLRSSSLIANRGYSRDHFEANLDLQLDLPMSQILSAAGRSEIP